MLSLNQKRYIGLSWCLYTTRSASDITWSIGVGRTVLYKWENKIIDNNSYPNMGKHKKTRLASERLIE